MTEQAPHPQGELSAAATVPAHKQVAASQLMGTLGVVGALAGLLIVIVFRVTQPTIQAHKAKMLRLAVQEVLKGPDRYDTLYVSNGALVSQPPPGTKPEELEKVYVGYRQDRELVGYAIPASGPGFQDIVSLIFGYDPVSGKLLGMKVLENKETPGLGDKIEKDARFVAQFDGVRAPLTGVKKGSGDANDPTRVEMITGATISSRTVIRLINDKLKRLQPVIEAHSREARQ